jgi:polyphosphate kinase
LSTGNFNESAAKLYTDFGYFTADERLTTEVRDVFHLLCREREKATFEHLLVPPFTMRERFQELIENEMRNARNGRDAFIIAKMNSLEDPEMIAKLYEASETGVRIRLIVRGVCCLIPGIRGMSENIEVISIVDRFLEHARVFVFHNDGAPLYFLSSADWMRRNLDRRIEVGFPVYDREIQQQLRATLDLQLQDNVKARIITKKLDNKIRSRKNAETVRSQYATYEFWKSTMH